MNSYAFESKSKDTLFYFKSKTIYTCFGFKTGWILIKYQFIYSKKKLKVVVFQKHKNTKLLINNLQFKWCRIFTMHSLLFILSYFTVDGLCKIFFFSI